MWQAKALTGTMSEHKSNLDSKLALISLELAQLCLEEIGQLLPEIYLLRCGKTTASMGLRRYERAARNLTKPHRSLSTTKKSAQRIGTPITQESVFVCSIGSISMTKI